MQIHDYTVDLVKQSLNTGPSAKDSPFKYTWTDIDLKELTDDEIDHLGRMALEITDRIEKEAFRREEAKQKLLNQ